MDLTQLKHFVQNVAQISASEWLEFAKHLRIKKLKKGEAFFSQGEHFGEIGYVLTGLIYTYYTDLNGEFAVKGFAWEGRLISPYAAQILEKPCFFTAKAWEDTWVATIKYSDMRRLYGKNLVWERMGRKSAEALLIEREKREYENLLLNAQERYLEFKKSFPQIFDRIPQWMIASYLGITPVALSRILGSMKNL